MTTPSSVFLGTLVDPESAAPVVSISAVAGAQASVSWKDGMAATAHAKLACVAAEPVLAAAIARLALGAAARSGSPQWAIDADIALMGKTPDTTKPWRAALCFWDAKGAPVATPECWADTPEHAVDGLLDKVPQNLRRSAA